MDIHEFYRLAMLPGSTQFEYMDTPVTSGYVVGGACPTVTVPTTSIYDAYRDYLHLSHVTGIVGTWRDPNTGLLDIDAVTIVHDYYTALALSVARGETAFYHIDTDTTYYTADAVLAA